jgi:metallo-beta-lactamase family protein
MCDGGRIQYHLRDNLWNEKSSIIFVGYQAEGTLGRKIVSGEKSLDIMEEMIDIKAEIYHLDGFSSHADQDELLWWLKGLKEKPKKVFIVHGEKQESEVFAKCIKEKLSIDTHIPAIGQTLLLQDNQIIYQGLIKDGNKETKLDEIARSIGKIKRKFSLLLTDMEYSGLELDREILVNKIKKQLEQLQGDIKQVKKLIQENEIEV